MQPCPRKAEATLSSQINHESHWRDLDGSCSYCGSISPDQFFAAIEAGAELGPTDKNYKVYVYLKVGDIDRFAQDLSTARGAYLQELAKKVQSLRKMRPHPKFYFQHLSEQEQDRFVQLLNEKKLKIGFPGHFYRLPYFIRIIDKPSQG